MKGILAVSRRWRLVRRLLPDAGMMETKSVDGGTLVWSLTGLVVAVVIGAMAYAVTIGLVNLPRIGV